ncbi:MAG: ribosome biogenesis GTPase Der, partial [Alphaproteobacteria bacterium]
MPILAIVGRPNVGKSTLFNRLVGRRQAIVDNQPGVTRDRRYGDATLADLAFSVIDTAGFDDGDEGVLAQGMRAQTERALEEADAALMLVDARAGVTPLDKTFAQILRRSGKPAALAANKCEGRAGAVGLIEAWELGLGDPVPISAEHAEGMSDLYDTIKALFEAAGLDARMPDEEEEEPAPAAAAAGEADEDVDVDAETVDDPARPIRLAIIGRPNVGKSTLLNQILGEDRALVGPEPGVTRDAISVDFVWRGRPVKLFDTAGMRRRARVHDRVEKKAVDDTLEAVRFADVVALVVEAETGLERQDLVIAQHAIDEGRALVLGANKWDAVADRDAALGRVRDRIMTSLPGAKGVSVTTLSGLTGLRVDRLLDAAVAAYDV